MRRRLLGDWLGEQAARRPEATALVAEERRVSFGDLDAITNRRARLLRESGCAPGDRVAILAPKGIPAVEAILACAKAGCVYVPVDTESPVLRTARILERARPRWVWAAPSMAKRLAELHAALPDARLQVASVEAPFEVQGVALVASAEDADALSAEPLDPGRRAEDVAHLLFTSGSTGFPKGVMITHRNVAGFVDWAVEHFGMGPDDRHSFHPPLHFDLSTFDLFAALASGAELHFLPPRVALLPRKLARWIADSALTQWFSVPSVLNYLASAEALDGLDFPALRRVVWCGEVLPTPTLVHWMQRLPGVRFTNLYGPTETTIASTWYDVPELPSDARAPIPIGRPCGGETAFVLDESGRQSAPGEIGDLYIGGVGVSPGYWEDAEKTAEAFVAPPEGLPVPDGERIYRTGDLAHRDEEGVIHFVGRADTQVKSRGYRIELGEIEAALQTLEALHESAVVAIPSPGFDGVTLCCAYTGRGPEAVAPAAVRKGLAEMVPAYMLPSRWLALPELPKNPNGKIDRPRLRELFEAEQAK